MTLIGGYGRLIVSVAGAAIINNWQYPSISGGAATYMFIINILITFM